MDFSEIYVSADKSIEELYLNDQSVKLDKDATSFSSVKNLGSVDGLESIALKATAADQAGVIATLITKSGFRVVSDELWKVFPSESGTTPSADKQGRKWFHPDYDDSSWKFATIDGRFGIPPWGPNAKPLKGFKSLKETMRVLTGEKFFGNYEVSLINANWIWSGNATYPVKNVFFRRSFAKNKFNSVVPPTRPYNLKIEQVTAEKAEFSWMGSLSHLGDVSYQIYWNGLHVKTLKETQAELEGFEFSVKRNNYIYIRAVDSAGNLSKTSPFKIVSIKDTVDPESPTDPAVTMLGSNKVALSWKPGSDDNEIRNYIIHLAKAVFIAPGGATSFKYSGKFIKPDTQYKAKIFTQDHQRNKSKPALISFKTTKEGVVAPPKASGGSDSPVLKVTGYTDRSAVFTWNRPGAMVKSGVVRILLEGKVVKVHKLQNVLSELQEIKGLEAGQTYTAILDFIFADGTKKSSKELTLTTVKLPSKNPLKVIASLTTPDGNHRSFKAALLDAKKENCEFLISFGNHGPQDRAQDKHWKNFVDAVNLVKKDMPVFMAPSSHDVQAALLDPVDPSYMSFSSGKYNRFMHHSGSKLNEVIDRDGVRIIWALSKSYDNKDQELFLQDAIHEADMNPAIKQVFILCTFQETIADWEKILVNSAKPVVVLDRYTNGNPGYAVTWEPGESFIQASSQRNRAKSADYQKIHIYEDVIYFEQRAKNSKTGNYETKVIHSIQYNREKHLVKPSMIRNRHTAGMVLGQTQQVNINPWAINKTIVLGADTKADFTLEGVCPFGSDLKYTIVRKPSSGELTGSGQNWSYKAGATLKENDYLLYRVNNGRKSQLAWIRFKK